MYSYATYYDILRYLQMNYPKVADATTTTIDDNTNYAGYSKARDRVKVMSIAREVSTRIDTVTRATFIPVTTTRYFDAALNDKIDPVRNVLRLDYPLASLTSVTLADDTSLTVDTQVRNEKRGQTPIFRLQILGDVAYWTDYTSEWRQEIEITGVWCWRDDYSNQGWVSTGDTVQDDPLSSSSTTLTVGNADGNDAYGLTPRFDVGQLLQIESEWVIVTAVSYSDETVTILRGQRGSTAASHAQETAISRFAVQPEVVSAASEIIAFEINRIGKHEQVQIGGGGFTAIQFPPDWPERAVKKLMLYTNYQTVSI
jgi:hypothetical protein